MDQATKELAGALRQAMQAERTGQTFYATAAHNTSDPVGKEVFEQLAAEEREHFEYLAAHYRSVIDTGQLAKDVTLSPHAGVSAESPIFSPALRERIKEAHFEMSALAIAVTLELNAIKHYSEQADKATTPEVKKLFAELAAWEKGHYDAMLRQQESLQDDYWSASGFSPF